MEAFYKWIKKIFFVVYNDDSLTFTYFLFKSTKRNESRLESNLCFSLDGFFLRDVDSVEELSDILVLHQHALLDGSSGLGYQFEVVSFEGDFVLLSGLDALDSLGHGHAPHVFLTQEISHLNGATTILDGNIDGEMGVDGLHLVAISVGDALHHVSDVTDHSTDSGDVFAAAEPFLSLESFLAEHLDVELGVLEGLLESSAFAGDSDDAVVHRALDVLGNLHLKARVNRLH